LSSVSSVAIFGSTDLLTVLRSLAGSLKVSCGSDKLESATLASLIGSCGYCGAASGPSWLITARGGSRVASSRCRAARCEARVVTGKIKSSVSCTYFASCSARSCILESWYRRDKPSANKLLKRGRLWLRSTG